MNFLKVRFIVTKKQFKRIAKETGTFEWKRYMDAFSVANREKPISTGSEMALIRMLARRPWALFLQGFRCKGHNLVNPGGVAKQHHQTINPQGVTRGRRHLFHIM
jgi:hypothetical protein